MLLKAPIFTLTVAATLGLGIGANAAVFSIVNAMLLRPLPVADPHNLYVLSVSHPGNDHPHPLSYADFVDYRAHADVFSDLAAYEPDFAGLSADNRADRLTVAYVTGNFFSMLGVGASPGRPVLPSEGSSPGADPIVVLGRAYWKKRFNGDPSAVGRRVLVNGRPFVIAGVVPEGFHGVYALVEFDAYLPLGMMFPPSAYKDLIEKRDNHGLHVLGRLKSGVALNDAQARLDVVARQLEQQYPATNKGVRSVLIPERLARPEPNAANSNPLIAGVFLALVALVLLVACVNVVNLLMVRATIRQRELAVRAALGANRARLVRQMLSEGLVLAVVGAFAGAIFGRWVSMLLMRIRMPMDLPIRFEFGFDWRVFAYIASVGLGAGVFVGLFPALRASCADLNDVLRDGARGMAEGSGRQRLRGALVVSQVAVSLVLLIAAGLFVRSVNRAQSIDLGFDPRHVLTLSMDVSQLGVDEPHGRQFYQAVESRIRTLSGIESVAYAYSVPFGYYNSSESVEAEDHPLPADQPKPSAAYNLVGPDYFRTLRIPIVRGRGFTDRDDERSRRVAVINEYMAHLLWPNQDPIGRHFKAADDGMLREVIGVTPTGKYRFIFEDPNPCYFEPIAQHYQPLRVLQIRTIGDPESLAPAVEREIRMLNPDLPVYDVRSLEHTLDGPNGFWLLRMGAMFGGALGLLGLVLALVGIYGVVSYSAAQRTQEIGVRMALGAQPSDILNLVVGQGLRLIGAGLLVGVVAALALSRVLGNLLFGISATDPTTFIAVPILLGAMALVASYLPALRATRIAPSVALRNG
jgi:putative ABC transport system permease protein